MQTCLESRVEGLDVDLAFAHESEDLGIGGRIFSGIAIDHKIGDPDFEHPEIMPAYHG